jgi:SAM-dependent methyltransferase
MIIDAFADWLGRRFPLVYRVARPPWRFVKRLFFRRSYWEKRRDYNYYQEAIRLARVYASSGRQVIDVGANETEVLRQLDWFERRVALDARYILPQAGIETIVMDFMNYQPESDFDLVLCLQVLEHLREPATFAKKLLETGRTVIISVPYRWPKGEHKEHLQDPVDEAKLELWTQRKPTTTSIIADQKKERLIAVYQL